MKKYVIEFKWAIIFSVVSLLWMCFEKLIGLHDEYIEKHATYTMLFSIPAVVIIIFALIDKRNNYYRGAMSWKQGFISGMIITLFLVILSPLNNFITFRFITPDYFSSMINFVTSTGLMSRTEAVKEFSFNNYLIQGLIGAAIMGTITSAIVAYFVRR